MRPRRYPKFLLKRIPRTCHPLPARPIKRGVREGPRRQDNYFLRSLQFLHSCILLSKSLLVGYVRVLYINSTSQQSLASLRDQCTHSRSPYHWVRCRKGGSGGGAPPRFWMKIIQYIPPPPLDFGWFCSEMF